MSMQAMELQIIRTDARISNANFSHGAALTPSEAGWLARQVEQR